MDTSWRRDATCSTLTPAESDAIFFTGPGGKVNKAKAFCQGCPVVSLCLEEALSNPDTKGFPAGTTESERKEMRALKGVAIHTVVQMEDDVILETRVTKRPVQRRLGRLTTYDALAGIEGPSLLELEDEPTFDFSFVD